MSQLMKLILLWLIYNVRREIKQIKVLNNPPLPLESLDLEQNKQSIAVSLWM